jgi:hypothetical protein
MFIRVRVKSFFMRLLFDAFANVVVIVNFCNVVLSWMFCVCQGTQREFRRPGASNQKGSR